MAVVKTLLLEDVRQRSQLLVEVLISHLVKKHSVKHQQEVTISQLDLRQDVI